MTAAPAPFRSDMVWSNFRVTGVYRAPVSRHCLRDQSVPGKDRPPSARGEYRGVVDGVGTLFFTILRFLDPRPEMLSRALINLAATIILASLPLLHRFGPLAAPLALIGFVYGFLIYVVTQVGMDGGGWLAYCRPPHLRCCWSAPNGYGCVSP